ncbi:hypothetical protein PHMEG_000577 [Phytophthora megakarya]|uniref:IPT/TIG domain-containing protein n=1 Tax=Phytophthora megakarya TaxID=4795 RepID=A0A225X3A1_9STRA|nr:hypothetical protein PHMEG_000577 [Phytophthora megakarya]
MNLTCHVGLYCVSGIVKSETTLECALPSKIPGNYTLGVSCAASAEVLGTFPIEYANPPRIESTTPSTVPAGGAYNVDFFGANIAREDLIFCIFGSPTTRVQTSFISSSHVRCSTRPNWMAGEVLLKVLHEYFDGQTELLHQSPFTFVDSIPGTTVLSPDVGSVVGGYPVSLALNTSWNSFENRSCKRFRELAMLCAEIKTWRVFRAILTKWARLSFD